ncbi:MAG: hypothetical protein ABSH36_02210 [Solirubrobacteraceae bacterium]
MRILKRFERPVRCREGHVFTTIWIPGGSLKAIRMGRWRWQRCPVGRHWTWVRRIDRDSAGFVELGAARAKRDIRVP